MPKHPMDYSKTIMYKLVCNDLNITDVYVGHTTDLKSRKYAHCRSVNEVKSNAYNSKKATFIRKHGGWENWSMIMIEPYPCSNKQEALSRERYWYETLNAKLNSIYPSRGRKEFYDSNKEVYKENFKAYYNDNKEMFKEKSKTYYTNNKEILLEQKKEYSKKNFESLFLKRAIKYECECGSSVRQYDKCRHFKSLKHCQFIENKNNVEVN